MAGGPYPIAPVPLGSNYAVTFIPASFAITPAPLVVSANSRSTVYGNSLPALTFGVSGLAGGDTPSVLGGALATSAGIRPGAGSYPITLGTLTAGPNYAIQFSPGTLTVTPAPLTILVAGKSKVYGAAVPALSFTATGLTYGQTAAGLTSVHLATKATRSSRVGSYAITASGRWCLNAVERLASRSIHASSRRDRTGRPPSRAFAVVRVLRHRVPVASLRASRSYSCTR